ncbi:MAG: Sua5/YciO/YrdC/YwlC family protein [Planctomycetota bacterium]
MTQEATTARLISTGVPSSGAEAVTEDRAVELAAEALRSGGMVVLPTETVYGVFAADDDAGRGALSAFLGESAVVGAAWHAASAGDAAKELGLLDARHRRLVNRLLPGPVTLVGPMGGRAVRVVETELTRRVLAAMGERRVIASAMAGRSQDGLALGDGRRLDRLADRLDALGAAGVSLVIDAGPARLGVVSTLIRLAPDGSADVTRRGAVPDHRVQRSLERRVLFVCTGNTCRSPMAESIARSLGSSRDYAGLRVASAGLSASSGAPMTPDAVAALRSRGIDPHDHVSRPLTDELVEWADEIYGLTASHLNVIAAGHPSSAGKTTLLDPEGSDVTDPFGGTHAVYDATCGALLGMVERRLGSGVEAPGRPA